MTRNNDIFKPQCQQNRNFSGSVVDENASISALRQLIKVKYTSKITEFSGKYTLRPNAAYTSR